jgi:RNA polymerase sigma-70 factor, ECF subfamily
LVPPASTLDNDDALLRALGEGDVHAVALLYQRHGAKMTSFARRYVKDQGSAEDVVAEVLGRWLERPPVVHDAERVAAFLARSVYHAAIDWIRRERSSQGRPPRAEDAVVVADRRLSGPIHDPGGESSKETLRRRMAGALDQLSDADRLLLEGHYAQALTPAESMRLLGINRAAFDQRLHRARLRLARLLATTGPAARKGAP